MIRKLAKPFALALALALPGAAALASSNDSVSQATLDAVRQKLVAEGYDVRSIQIEDELIEVYALKDGRKLEIYLDASLNILRTKVDD